MDLDVDHEPIDRSQPPQPGTPTSHSFPPFSEQRMRNGIPVYVVANHAQPYVSMMITLRSGSSYDGGLAGLASFVGGMLLSGAGARNAEELAEAIDFLGATIDVSAGRDDITIKLGVLTRYLSEALDLVADLVLRPTFPNDEIARERRHSIASLKQAQSDPSFLASVQFRREAYGESPYGTEVDGTAESIARIRRKHCVEFHGRHFTAGNAFIVAAGDVDTDALLAMLEERLSEWSGERPSSVVWQDPGAGTTPRVVIVDRSDAMQSAIRIGAVAISRTHPDFIPLVTLHTLFGGYFNSRINQNLRERNAYTYGAGSTVEALAMPGSVSVRASVGIEVTSAAVGEIVHELHTIAIEMISEEELVMVTNYILGSQALQIETPGQIAGFVRAIALYDLPHDYYSQFPATIRAVTRERIFEVAQRYMHPSRMIVVVVGDAEKIRDEMEKYGPVSVVGADGES